MEIVAFIFGLILASFINALAYRINNGYRIPEIFVKSSHCEKCNHKLLWYEMIPVFSYIFTNGVCMKCDKKIFWYYPVSELILGLSFLLMYRYSVPVQSYLILIFLYYLSYYDVKSKSIPKMETDCFLVVVLLYKAVLVLLNGFNFNRDIGIVMCLGILFIYVPFKYMKNSLGMGDIVVLCSLLLISSFGSSLILLYATLLLSGVFAFTLVLLDRRWLKRYIPLLPFITLGYTLSTILSFPIVDIVKFL